MMMERRCRQRSRSSRQCSRSSHRGSSENTIEQQIVSGLAKVIAPLKQKNTRKDEGKALLMEDCAAIAFDRVRRTCRRPGGLPRTFVRFHTSPLMMIWLHTITSYFKHYFQHKRTEAELKERMKTSERRPFREPYKPTLNASSSSSSSSFKKGGLVRERSWDSKKNHLTFTIARKASRLARNHHHNQQHRQHDNGSETPEHRRPSFDITGATSALIGSSKAARSPHAIAALSKSEKHLQVVLQRTLANLSKVYCRMVVAFSNSESPLVDRSFFALVFQLTLFVLDLLMPDQIREAQPEMYRLLTALDHMNVCDAKRLGLEVNVEPPPNDASVPSPGGDRRRSYSIAPTHLTVSNVFQPLNKDMPSPTGEKPKCVALRDMAANNVEASKQFLEAAAARFSKRREARNATKCRRDVRAICSHSAMKKNSPLVARVLDAVNDPNDDDGLFQSPSDEAEAGAGSIFGLPTTTTTRTKPKEDELSQALPTALRHFLHATPMSDATRDARRSSPASGIFSRRYTPARRQTRTQVQDTLTSARLAAARNSVAVFDQQLVNLLNQRAPSIQMSNTEKPP